MVTEELYLTDAVTNSHENAELSEVSCMVHYLNDCTDIAAEEVASETFNVKMKKRNTS